MGVTVPGFHTYEPPEKNVALRENSYTKEEVKEMLKKEFEYRQVQKEARKRRRKSAQTERNKKRARAI